MTAELYDKIREYNPTFDQSRIKQAYDFVLEKYQDTEGGMAYPMKVLEVLLPIKPDEDTIIAVLLHDLYLAALLNDDLIKTLFGQPVLQILAALKRLLELNYAENNKSAQTEVLRKMLPKISYRHPHDPSHAEDHMLSAIIGTSISLIFQSKRLVLGTWQRVVLIELNGPKTRRIAYSIV